MNHKKPLANVAELRAEEPNPQAVDRTVDAVLSYRPTPTPSRTRWRMATVAAGIVALAGVGYITAQPASAAGLEQIAAALQKQQTRHSKTVRPDTSGKLVVTNEDWIDGRKHKMLFFDGNGQTINGYDGRLMFNYSDKDGGFVDDSEPISLPIEDLKTYLNIPNGKLAHRQLGVNVDGRVGDLYRMDFGGMRFDLYIDPATHLPFRRDVLKASGDLIERNFYDYPARISAETFKAPTGLCDYPALRSLLAKRVAQPGVVKQVGGTRIDLKAVIVGKHRVLAVWTGGAKGEFVQGADMQIEGQPVIAVSGRPDAFANPRIGPATPEKDLLAGREVLRGDGAWITPETKLGKSFRISVPVWAEDRTKPMKPRGYHSKLVGRVTFDVKNPIYAQDPDRVLWRPDGGVQEATGIASTEPKP